jgi:mannose-6-phosphate isomerase
LQPSEARFQRAVEDTLACLDRDFADTIGGGLWDCIPRPDELRRQNPHMHLLEAMLELYEVTAERDFLDRSQALVTLALERFISSETGALREYFDNDWEAVPVDGGRIVEPGHQFEWAWLLRRYEALGGTAPAAQSAVERLIGWGLDGTDAALGRIVDQLDESGKLRLASSRCWPHCEALKILSIESRETGALATPLIERLWQRISTRFCRDELSGGWIDLLDEQDRPDSVDMPASTLYHLMFALAQWEDVFLKPERELDFGPPVVSGNDGIRPHE